MDVWHVASHAVCTHAVLCTHLANFVLSRGRVAKGENPTQEFKSNNLDRLEFRQFIADTLIEKKTTLSTLT